MADCNNCSSYLSSEDIIRRSVKCSGGSVAFIGSNVNPFDGLAPTGLTATPISDVQINLAWTVNSANATGHRIYISTDNLTFTAHSTVALPGNSASITGLSNYTRYYFKVVAYSGTESIAATADTFTFYYATLTATGDGTGVSTLKLAVTTTEAIEIVSGNAKFYTNEAGTLGESATWNIVEGGLRTIYLKAPSGDSKIKITTPSKIILLGGSLNSGWNSSTNAAYLSIDVSKLGLLILTILGKSNIIGNVSASLSELYLAGLEITWVNDNSLPDGIRYLYISSPLVNWTGLSIGNNGNVTTLTLSNYRDAKMSSADMITLLTQLTNRTGTLPSGIMINDYADYASPPIAVTNAVTLLKSTKSIITVTLGS